MRTQKAFRVDADDVMYGTTVIGARGQVVIPSEARKDLKLRPGDKLLVFGKLNKALGLIKAEHLEEFIKTVMQMISSNGQNEIKRSSRWHFEKIKKINK